MNKFLFTTLLFLTFISHSFCQGELYNSGESGFFLSGQFGSAEGSALLGLSSGFTANGKVTFGISLGLEDYNDLDITSTAIRPFIGYRVVRQEENNAPINVNLGAAYQYNTFKDLDLTGGTISLSSTISHIITTPSGFRVIPLGGISYNRTTLNLAGYKEATSLLGFNIGASLMLNQFYLTPVIGFSDGNSNFNLLFGMLFSNY